jgi:hypothetical protein
MEVISTQLVVILSVIMLITFYVGGLIILKVHK